MRIKNNMYLSTISLISIAFATQNVEAQEPAQARVEDRVGETEAIVITATKRAGGEIAQNAPLTISALGQKQLEEGHYRDLQAISDAIPNVYLNGLVLFKGAATFSIRGMAVYSTIPSSTPAVGVFADGMYLGLNAGSVLDTFDVAGIEVLRGPQGLLFGRNVTAGAILVRTTNPTDELTLSLRGSVESGPAYTVSGVVAGPLTENAVLTGKLGAYHYDDRGYFTNLANGNDHFGRYNTDIVRGALGFRPNGDVRSVVKLEYGDSSGDGPAGQNHALFDRNSFDFSIDTEGYAKLRWKQAIWETSFDVGGGQIVNIAGWRDLTQNSLTDIDATPQLLFDGYSHIDHEQWSDELRYSGTFGPVEPTIGIFYYEDRLNYIERRVIPPAGADLTGGGKQRSSTWAIFGNFDINLTDAFTLNLGARYSTEEKTASIQRIVPTAGSPCSLSAERCMSYTDPDLTENWNAFTPKIGLQWQPTDDTNLYAYWTKGYRSGGFNVRKTTAAPVTPYDQEVEDTYEVGLKQELFDNRVTANVAVFRNVFKKLQRDVNRPDPMFGNVQETVNAADVTIDGVEVEATARLTPAFTIGGNVGYLDGDFDLIRFNLVGPPTVGPEDYALRLPFLSKWSYGVHAEYVHNLNFAELSARVSFNHRARAFSDDINVGVLAPVNNLAANLSFAFDQSLQVSFYGKNLLDRTTFGVDTPIPFPGPGATFSPLNKGRVLGAELRYRY